jgi:undecaprenyl diphosphate synthase
VTKLLHETKQKTNTDTTTAISTSLTEQDIQQYITEEHLHSCLDTYDVPDPDLFIRTSGEMRLSNFLLWNVAYTELYFTNTYWPDFTMEEFHTALVWYSQRQRRFGGK